MSAAATLAECHALIAARKLDQAQALLARGLAAAPPPAERAGMQAALAEILRRRGRAAEALAALDAASAADPALPGLGAQRAELLHDNGRHDEALALYRALIARDPFNVALHTDYNDLLWRLDRSDEFLKSFDRAPPNRGLYHAKARFLMHARRHGEAAEVFAAILAREPSNMEAGAGRATCLSQMGRHGEAADLFTQLIAQGRADANLHANAAAARLRQGAAREALALCEAGLARAADNQVCLALKGTALRLLDDARDENLMGYDRLVAVMDLAPPPGFADMAAFNAELDAYLDRLHPHTGAHIAQSLRGGSQTVEEVFGCGHDLIDRLQQRIHAAVTRYIAELPDDAAHPFTSRRRRKFDYAGSWSSRLQTQGFHANHLHPGGWISSCYYVAVPPAAADAQARQGWIKFGEPDIAVTLAQPVRRAIQPRPGRLVLFPSYMWHGTIAFRDAAARTTIAFDAVPV